MHAEVSDALIRDIHLPEAVGWWPPPMGWWLLLLFVLLQIVLLLLYFRKHKYRNIQKAASRELDALYLTYRKHADPARFVTELSVLLRRISVTRYGATHAAHLTGKKWLEFLDRGLRPKLNRSGYKFSGDIGQCLITSPYSKAPCADIDVDGLHRLALEWVASLSAPNELDKIIQREVPGEGYVSV